MIPRLKEQYDKKIVIDLQKKFSMKNKLMVPRVTKVVLNMGLGLDANDKKIVQNSLEDVSLISGQKPIITKFKKSISNFKTRKGTAAGIKVTLRSNKMYEFIDRLVNIALPRIKDFRGLSMSGFDNFGNYSLGIKEHIIFPEIDFDKVNQIRGMDITLVTTGRDKKTTLALLEAMNFPFIKKIEKKGINWGDMAKTSAIQRNLKRIKLAKKFLKKRESLKKIIKNKKLPLEERFAAQLKLAKIPRNSAKVRIRNRCEITGRPHGVYRKLKISRIALRDLASKGKIPGMTKSSW